MAAVVDPLQKQSLESINALAEIERARSTENSKTVKYIAQNFLGHIYNKQTGQIEEMAVAVLDPNDIVLDHAESLYMATIDAVTDAALDRLNQTFGFNIASTIKSASLEAQAEIDLGRSKIESSDASTYVCAVACVHKDRVGFQTTPKRLGVESESFHSEIIKSIVVYTGYRIILEITFKTDKSEKKVNVGGKAGGSTLSKLLGIGIQFTSENSSLINRKIERINIKEILGIGGYRIPKIEIASENDFLKIQEKFENIREHFEIHHYSIADRSICVQRDGLIPLRESVSSSSQVSIEIPSKTNLNLSAPTIRRDATYYKQFVQEFHIYDGHYFASEKEYKIFSSEMMLHAMETSFSNLVRAPKGKRSFLLVGTDSLTTRSQAVRLHGGEIHRGKALYPNGRSESVTKFYVPGRPLQSIFIPDNFNDERCIPSVFVYNNAVETPILTSANIPSEFDICLGVATEHAISHFAPSKIIFCIPYDFFEFSGETELVKKMNTVFNSLRRIIYDPVSCRASILFVIDDQQNSQLRPLEETVPLAFSTLKKYEAKLQESLGSVLGIPIGPIVKFFQSVCNRTPEEEARIRSAIDACVFIVNRLVCSSNLNDILSCKEDCFSFYPEFKIIAERQVKKLDRSEKRTLENISPDSFDKANMTLYNSFTFKSFLNLILFSLDHRQDMINGLESRGDTILEILHSYDRVLTAFKKNELENLGKEEAEKILGKAIADEIAKWIPKKLEKEKKIKGNTETIEKNKNQIESLKKDTTPTALKLHSNSPITMRPIWRIPPFGEQYIFETKYNFSKCEFSKSPGTFDCSTAEFMNKKKTVFTPKHWGHEDDLRAQVQIWIEKREHPQTQSEIKNCEYDNKRLEEENKTLQQELDEINSTLTSIENKSVPEIESKLGTKTSEFLAAQEDLNRQRLDFDRHREYYEILSEIKNEMH